MTNTWVEIFWVNNVGFCFLGDSLAWAVYHLSLPVCLTYMLMIRTISLTIRLSRHLCGYLSYLNVKECKHTDGVYCICTITPAGRTIFVTDRQDSVPLLICKGQQRLWVWHPTECMLLKIRCTKNLVFDINLCELY